MIEQFMQSKHSFPTLDEITKLERIVKHIFWSILAHLSRRLIGELIIVAYQ